MSNEKKMSEVNRWRKNFEAAEAELQDKSHQWQDAQDFLLNTVTKLARLADSADGLVTKEINIIAAASKNSADVMSLKTTVDQLLKKLVAQTDDVSNDECHRAVLIILLDKLSTSAVSSDKIIAMQQRVRQVQDESQLSQIVDELAEVWEQTHNSSTIEPSKICALLVAEILYQLLEKINLPEHLADRLGRLKKELEVGVKSDRWVNMLSEIADMASAVQININKERLDVEKFLLQVTGRLQELDSFIVGSFSQDKQSFLNGRDFGEAVKKEMHALALGADEEMDVNVLKEKVQLRLAAIEEHFNGFKVSEAERIKMADSDVEKLKARLSVLEEESKTLRSRINKERMQAQIDALTGVPNRLGYEQHIAQEFARWKRFKNSLVLIVCDIDRFKRINDDYGHAAGDKALKTLAKVLSKNIRETDYLARYGGEEFALIMPGATQSDAKMVAEKLRQSIESSGFHFKNEPLTITMSCGVAEFKKGDVPTDVFERADAALYKAKQTGRNKVVIAK